MAVSPEGEVMVSASDNPPTLYLTALANSSRRPILIQPRASGTAVTVMAFHPARSRMLLLGFADGTLAAFDMTMLTGCQKGIFANQEAVNKAEVCHFSRLHRSAHSQRRAVTSAAFLPSYDARAVSVGMDGRCRLVDFSEGGVLVRTWSVGAAATSVSVLPTGGVSSSAQTTAIPRAGFQSDAPRSEVLIAVGRIDGVIQLYSPFGLLVGQTSLRGSTGKIISVEWMPGVAPRAASDSFLGNTAHIRPRKPTKASRIPRNAELRAVGPPARRPVTEARPHPDGNYLGLPPGLRKDAGDIGKDTHPRRVFVTHPDEEQEDTVRYRPSIAIAKKSPVQGQQYQDLFSQNLAGPKQRQRLRISDQTFLHSSHSDLYRPERPSAQTHEKLSARKRIVKALHRQADHIETAEGSVRALRLYGQVHGEQAWPEDSHQGSSLEDDGWVTTDSEQKKKVRKKRLRARPPARQTSRSHVGSRGTMSTVALDPGKHHQTEIAGHMFVDGYGSEEEDAGDTQLLAGSFAPSSEDIRRLFPRSSSLPSRQWHRRRPRPRP